MMRFRPEGFLPSRQRAAELSVHGLQVAEAEMGVEVETDNVAGGAGVARASSIA